MKKKNENSLIFGKTLMVPNRIVGIMRIAEGYKNMGELNMQLAK